jgi:hypothetical protein
MWKTWTGGPQASPISSPQAGGPGVGSPGGWHPTVLYLVFLILAEFAAVALLSRTLLR